MNTVSPSILSSTAIVPGADVSNAVCDKLPRIASAGMKSIYFFNLSYQLQLQRMFVALRNARLSIPRLVVRPTKLDRYNALHVLVVQL